MAKKTKKAAKKKPAAKKKSSTSKTAKSTLAAPVFVFMSGTAVARLADDCSELEKSKNTLSGDVGNLIKEAKQKHHLHTGAFRIYRGMKKMSPRDIALMLPHLLFYIDKGGLQKIADQQLDMFKKIDAKAEEELKQKEAAEDKREAKAAKQKTEAKTETEAPPADEKKPGLTVIGGTEAASATG